MKIYRFRAPGYSYGFICANIFERKALNKRIECGDSGIETLASLEKRLRGNCCGPRRYGAQFVIRPKQRKFHRKYQQGEQLWKKCVNTLLGKLFPFRIRVLLLEE
jgi:hypothetical protein